MNSDGVVDRLDLHVLTENYRSGSGTGDIDGDEKVALLDLALLQSRFGGEWPQSPPNANDDAYTFRQGSPIRVLARPEQPAQSGDSWRYLDSGEDQGTEWTARDFDDSAWLSGASPLGYGNRFEATVVSYGNDRDNKFTTTYFRRTFDLANPELFQRGELRFIRDDGIAVYVNGVEVLRDNLRPNAEFKDFATDTIGGSDESTFRSTIVDTANLSLEAEGNVIAAEIHQSHPSSSDISFDLELETSQLGMLSNDSDTDTDMADLLISLIDVSEFDGVATIDVEPDGSFEIVPNDPATFVGEYSFTYQLSDGESLSLPATVTIMVTPVPAEASPQAVVTAIDNEQIIEPIRRIMLGERWRDSEDLSRNDVSDRRIQQNGRNKSQRITKSASVEIEGSSDRNILSSIRRFRRDQRLAVRNLVDSVIVDWI